MNTEQIRENTERVVKELTRLRDEVRVKLNLLGKELRDRWGEMDKQVDEVVHLARSASESVLERARSLRDELRRELARGKDTPTPPPAARP